MHRTPLAAQAVDDLMSAIDDVGVFENSAYPSKPARARAYAKHVRRSRKAAAAIEELARHGHRDELVSLLDHVNSDVRADVAAVLLGFHAASQGGRPAKWGVADRDALAAVAALWDSPTTHATYWAARAHFALDPATAIDRFIGELRPGALDEVGGERRWCDAIRAAPDDLGEAGSRWYRALSGALVWAPPVLGSAIVRHLESAAVEELIAALAHPLPDEPDAPVARVTQIADAGWDGGPMVLLPGQIASAWEGADPPSNGRVVDCTYRYDDPDAPATDYDLACESVALDATLIDVGAGHALVTPMSYLALATCEGFDGFICVVCGEDAQVARWALTAEGVGWRPVGHLAIDGTVWIQSAALRGGETGGARVTLPAGDYRLAELRFLDERGELHILRGTRE